MVVLDADSLMTGAAVSTLVRLMETNARAGIIQTMPRLVKTETLFGRIQQFASRVYSPIFAAGLNFWQQGEGNYWGHNAIIRVSPFLASCALPGLPGKEPLGGRILSHDFVDGKSGSLTIWREVTKDCLPISLNTSREIAAGVRVTCNISGSSWPGTFERSVGFT